MSIFGTSYFVSLKAAVRYYAEYNVGPIEVGHKLSEGTVHIGQPTLKEGETLVVIDNGTRYAIRKVTK